MSPKKGRLGGGVTPGARLVNVDTDHCNDQATVCCWHHKYGTCLLTLQSTLRQPAPPGPRQGNSLRYKLSKNAISETGVYATKAKRQAKLHPESDICRLTMFFFFPHLVGRIVMVMHCVVYPVFKYPIQLDSWIAHYRTSFCESKMCFKWKHLV